MASGYVQGYIDGFDQSELLALGLDIIDAYIFQWYLDFAGSGNMMPLRDTNGTIVMQNGKIYYMVRYQAILEAFPIFGITTTRMVALRFEKYLKLGLFTKIVKQTRYGKVAFFASTDKLFLLKFNKAKFENGANAEKPMSSGVENPKESGTNALPAIGGEAKEAKRNEFDMAIQAKSISYGHAKSISHGQAKSISDALNNPAAYPSCGLNNPAAYKSPPEEADCPAETAAAVSTLQNIKKTVCDLFSTPVYPLSDDFAPKLLQLAKEMHLNEMLLPEYLRYHCKICEVRKPVNITAYFYKTAVEASYMAAFLKVKGEEVKKREAQRLTCPVCGSVHTKGEDCPVCGLAEYQLHDEESLQQQRKIYALPESIREQLQQELEALSAESGADIAHYTSNKQRILQKYISA